MNKKQNKRIVNLSKRIFNKFFLFNFIFFSLINNPLIKIDKFKRKKVKFKEFVWLLNEND